MSSTLVASIAWARRAGELVPISGTMSSPRVSDQAIAHSIPVHERMEALALIHDGVRCQGAIARNLVSGELTAYVAKATAIASGGAGRLYRTTTNAVICEGVGTALALETGVAAVLDWGPDGPLDQALDPDRYLAASGEIDPAAPLQILSRLHDQAGQEIFLVL